MPKLILRCNYLKNAPSSHLQNFVQYLGTREGVEKVADTTAQLPATASQKQLIQDILHRVTDADRMHEYYDYQQRPTRENASEFITQALENNLDLIAKKKNYIDYLANRPRVEKIGSHGLFSYEGESVVLSKVADEVANHKGVIWTNVVSLRREDAERLGYDCAAQWQELLRSRAQTFAENYKIDSANLKWYAAFHNESHHPHVHLVIYSTNPAEGYLTKQGIEAMRSILAHDIFRQEFMNIYEKKTEQRNLVKEQAEEMLQQLIGQMQEGVCHNEKIAEQMLCLAQRLQNTGGKKVYGYLKADVKKIVNSIVDELATEPAVAECYRKWQECQNEIYGFYKDTETEYPALSEQKEFKSIKNRVISEALKLGDGFFYFDDAGNETVGYEQTDFATEDWEEFPDDVQENQVGIAEDNEPDIRREYQTFYVSWNDVFKEARVYLYGGVVHEQSYEKAFYMMLGEAEKGNAYASYELAKMYEQGNGVEQDDAFADRYYHAAFTGFVQMSYKDRDDKLLYRIGAMHLKGKGTEVNLEKARKYFKESADQGNNYAAYHLGKLYLTGDGGEKGVSLALRYLTQAADADNPYAQYAVGKLYLMGKEVAQDKEKAIAYLTKAAEQGNEYAAFLLEHWQDRQQPDAMLMAVRLLRQLGNIFEQQSSEKRRGNRSGIDRKLRRRIREKKIAQGHASDDHVQVM